MTADRFQVQRQQAISDGAKCRRSGAQPAPTGSSVVRRGMWRTGASDRGMGGSGDFLDHLLDPLANFRKGRVGVVGLSDAQGLARRKTPPDDGAFQIYFGSCCPSYSRRHPPPPQLVAGEDVREAGQADQCRRRHVTGSSPDGKVKRESIEGKRGSRYSEA